MARPRRGAHIGRLLRLARPEAGLLAAGLIFLAIGSAATLAYPQGVRVVIDAALGTSPEWAGEVGRARLLELVAIAMAGIALVSAAAMGIRFYLFVLAGERVITRVRKDLYHAIMAQEVAFFDKE